MNCSSEEGGSCHEINVIDHTTDI